MNDAVIAANNIVKTYKNVKALDGISMEMKRGEILAFLGPNGAGKTSAVNIFTGLLRQDSGEIYYNGRPFHPLNPAQKRMIGVVPQHNNIDRDLTVKDNLKIHAKLFGIKRARIDASIDKALDRVGLKDQKYKNSGALSGGMKRRLVIARALMHEPSVLFLDEPSAGLDPESRRNLYAVIRGLNRDTGVSILLTTHYMEEADILSSRVIFIDRGVIAASGKPEELKAAMGSYALEYAENNEYKTFYFKSRKDAVNAASLRSGDVKIREITLEDVYLKLTGKKMGEKYV